jgi:DNA-directed RNA polymerase subunit RPC12/RpoP
MGYICKKCGTEVKGRIDSPVLEALEICEKCRLGEAIQEEIGG